MTHEVSNRRIEVMISSSPKYALDRSKPRHLGEPQIPQKNLFSSYWESREVTKHKVFIELQGGGTPSVQNT